MSSASDKRPLLTCPGCGQVDGYWDTFVGVEVRGVYDGVLIWQCPTCQTMWPRFSEGRLRDHARRLIAEQAAGMSVR